MRTHVKKEKAIHEALTAAILAAKKICPFFWETLFFFFKSHLENAAFMWVRNCYKKKTFLESNIIQEKVSSL